MPNQNPPSPIESLRAPLRVLHCPDIVGGHPQTLAKAERALGVDSWSVAFRASRFAYRSDEILCRTDDGRLTQEWRRLQLLGRALRRFDVVHFNFGQSILPGRFFADAGPPSWKLRLRNGVVGLFELRDLPLLKSFGKKIVVTFQGDDARQGDRLAGYAEWKITEELSPDYYPPGSDAHKRWRIERFGRHADMIYALNPDLLRVLPPGAKFQPYANVDPAEWQVASPSGRSVPLVLHAPTHRGIKGTRHVLDAVRRLQNEGVPFQFELVEGLTHAQAMERYRQADLVVDQLLLGWYGGLAVEVMALGKPVIAHIRESDLRFVPAEMRDEIPVIGALPATIYEVLKEWLTGRRHELAAVGMRSRAYVERWHDPLQIARMTKADYERIIS